ncbi:DUF4249 family protein [Pedobacter sp. AW31-3R]|uniref:DUF4249 family protein n=1 Tax=Pedobacter sp. AW31-3R TaxID=3445781 RepID=UPI003F9F18E9
MVTRYNYKKIFFSSIILLLCFIAACKKDSAQNVAVLPVVEAYLMPGKIVQVRVSQQKALVDTNAYGVAIGGLELKVSDGTNTYELTEDKTGHYILNDTTFVKVKGSYSLSFTYNNLPVTASTTMPEKPVGLAIDADTVIIPKMVWGEDRTEFIPVTASWGNAGSYNHVLLFKYQETWKSLISNQFNRDTTTSVELNVVKTTSFELNERSFKYYGRYKVILIRVNDEYVEMLNSGTTTSHNLTNPPTNLTNGLGIFTAMQADTLLTNLLVKAEE